MNDQSTEIPEHVGRSFDHRRFELYEASIDPPGRDNPNFSQARFDTLKDERNKIMVRLDEIIRYNHDPDDGPVLIERLVHLVAEEEFEFNKFLRTVT